MSWTAFGPCQTFPAKQASFDFGWTERRRTFAFTAKKGTRRSRLWFTSAATVCSQRNAEMNWETDITGFSDFVDPIDLVERVAKSPPRRLIVLTDPDDSIVPAASQSAYVAALRKAGVAVDHRLVRALVSWIRSSLDYALSSARRGKPHLILRARRSLASRRMLQRAASEQRTGCVLRGRFAAPQDEAGIRRTSESGH